MKVWLAELRPVDLATGNEVIIRLSGSSAWTSADGQVWKPRLALPLRRSMQFFDGEFQDQPQEVGQLEFILGAEDTPEWLASYGWDGRPVKIWRGDVGQDTAAMQVMFDGYAEEATGNKRRVSVTLKMKKLDTPLLTQTYAGTGGAEGSVDLKNVSKPMLLGVAQNVQPVFINEGLGIFQYHAYGNLAGQASPTILACYDNGAPLGASVGDYPTYAALAAATVPGGQYATCNALGLGRHGGELVGELTIDARGAVGTGLPGSIIKFLCQHAGFAQYNAADLDWLDTHLATVPQDLWFDQQTTTEDAIRELMLSLGGYLWFRSSGELTVGLVRLGEDPTVTLDRLNIAQGLRVMPTKPPLWMRKQGYARSWRVHSYSEVRTPREIVPRGEWVDGTGYVYYDMVQHDGRSWIYVSGVPNQATEPGTDPLVWQLFSTDGAPIYSQATAPAGAPRGALWRNTSSGLFSWYDGTSWVGIADVTAVNVAAGIVGQGALATANAVNWGTQVTGEGRPEDYATQTGLGPNELIDDTFRATHWNLPPAATRQVRNASGGFAEGFAPYLLQWAVPGAGEVQIEANNFPRRVVVAPGRRYYGGVWLQKSAGVPDGTPIVVGFTFHDGTGAEIADSLSYTTAYAVDLAVGAVPKLYTWSGIAPANAATVRFWLVVIPTAGGAGYIRFERPIFSQVGQVASASGPATKSIKYDYQGAVLAGELPVDLQYALALNGVQQSAGVTWTYQVLTGTVNTFTNASGVKPMTGTGGGALTISSLGSNTATVRVTGTSGGISSSLTVTLTKEFGAPPTGSGGTGPVTIASYNAGGLDSLDDATFTDLTGSLTGTMPAGKTTANLSATVDLNIFPTNAAGLNTSEFKYQRKITGVWTDQGTVQSCTAREGIIDSETQQYGVEPGQALLSFSDTGLTAGASYEWRVVGRRTAGARVGYANVNAVVTA